eukprot:1244546-Pyramimonas_sp.AAC.1
MATWTRRSDSRNVYAQPIAQQHAELCAKCMQDDLNAQLWHGTPLKTAARTLRTGGQNSHLEPPALHAQVVKTHLEQAVLHAQPALPAQVVKTHLEQPVLHAQVVKTLALNSP